MLRHKLPEGKEYLCKRIPLRGNHLPEWERTVEKITEEKKRL